MKTLADFKRALIVGSRWNCVNELHHCNYGIREVVYKDTVKVGFKIIEGILKDNVKISYLYFPKSDLVKFEGEEIHIFFPADERNNTPRRHILTYKSVV